MSTSPAVKTQPTMDIGDAIRCIAKGLKVTKLEWDDARVYGVLVGGKVVLHKTGEEYQFYPWILSDGDLAGNDWIVVNEDVVH